MYHYYHIYADGKWQTPVREHFAALTDLDFDRVVVGIVGNPFNVAEVENHLDDLPDKIHTWDTGWEQRTLDLIFNDVPPGPVFYAHTKGAANPGPVQDTWRRCMNRHLIGDWAPGLLSQHDTVGCHWLTPEEHPRLVTIPYYGGNFWWASPEHIRRLPPPSEATRYHAEAWLGTVRPKNPADLAPGWPGAGCRSHRFTS